MDNDTLRYCLIAALLAVIGLLLWVAWLHAKLVGANMVLPPLSVPAPPPPPPLFVPRLLFLPTIQAFYKDSEYNYVAIADPPGFVVLAWREWAGNGYKDRALDVLLVKKDGTVETLGTCIEFEVFGPPPEKTHKEE